MQILSSAHHQFINPAAVDQYTYNLWLIEKDYTVFIFFTQNYDKIV